MSESEGMHPEQDLRQRDARLLRLRCQRTGEWVDAREHVRCPYCFGDLADVETGRHEAFCDFHAGMDPVHFGFPRDDERSRRG